MDERAYRPVGMTRIYRAIIERRRQKAEQSKAEIDINLSMPSICAPARRREYDILTPVVPSCEMPMRSAATTIFDIGFLAVPSRRS